MLRHQPLPPRIPGPAAILIALMRAECAGPAGGRRPARSADGDPAPDPLPGRRPATSDVAGGRRCWPQVEAKVAAGLTTGCRLGRHDGLMPGTKQADGSATAPLPVLFLMADTGGGHRNAARAVGESLELAYPGRFAPVLCDPLGGPGSARLLRWVTGLYGPPSGWPRGCGAPPITPPTCARPCGYCGAPCCGPPTGWQPARPGRTGPRRSCRSTRSPAWPRSGRGIRLRRWRPW